MKPVLLIFPGSKENQPRIPFSVLVLSSYLRKKNIPSEILDTRIQDYKNINYDKYSLIGLSVKTGEQVTSSVEICEYIRKNSKTPIVFGGPHPTFFPEQTCNSKLVDFVVRGEGEETLYELVKEINGKKRFKRIKGLTFKKDEKIINNEERDFIDMDVLDLPAYDMINLNDYSESEKFFTIETSRGCPHQCSFCYVHKFHKRKWRYKNIQKVINEIEKIIKSYGVTSFFITDDNFFVQKPRVIEFCKEIINKKLNIKIFTQARANYFANYPDEVVKLISQAGFEFIGIGAESGSQKVLDMIKKDIKVEDIFDSAKKCIKYGIKPLYSFVIGIPGESWEDLNQTIDAYIKLKGISNDVEVSGLIIFTPYPGTPLYDEAIKQGYKPAQTFEGWGEWKFSDLSNVTWLNKEEKDKLQVLNKLSQFMCIKDRASSYGKDYKRKRIGSIFKYALWSIGSPILGMDANLRLKHKFLSMGYEWFLFEKIARKEMKAYF